MQNFVTALKGLPEYACVSTCFTDKVRVFLIFFFTSYIFLMFKKVCPYSQIALHFSFQITKIKYKFNTYSHLIFLIRMMYNNIVFKFNKEFQSCLKYITLIIFQVEILSSLQKPKKISLKGSDGKFYIMMCKPKDDLRKDCRLMEFNSLINKVGNSSLFKDLFISFLICVRV